MAAGGSGSPTYSITADASQALAEFRKVTKAALETEQIKGAGTPIAGPKFTKGLFTAASREAEDFKKDLDRISVAIKQLEGAKLPKDFFPGFKGGTAAEAIQFRGVQAQKNIAGTIGTKAALAGIDVPKALVTEITQKFQQLYQSVARNLVKSLNQTIPEAQRASVGTTRQVQLAQGDRSVQGAAEGARTTVLTRQEAARTADEQARVDKADAKRLANEQAANDREAEKARKREETRQRLLKEAADRKTAREAQAAADKATREARAAADKAAARAANQQAAQAVMAPKANGTNLPLNFASGSLPVPPVVSFASSAGVKRNANTQIPSQLPASINDSLVERQHAAEQERINAYNLRESNKALSSGTFEAANGVIVDFRNGLLNLFDRTRHGESLIPRDDPAFPSALEGALRTPQQAFDYVEGQRRTNPNSVTDLGKGQVAVKDATTGALNFFNAVQAGVRQLITTRPEAERAFTRYQQVMQDRANFDRVEANKARNPQNVIDVGRGRVVDVTSGQPLAFKGNEEGLRELSPRQSKASLKRAQDILDQRELKSIVDRDRATRPQDFVQLSSTAFADIGNKQRDIYDITEHGYNDQIKNAKRLATLQASLDSKIEVHPVTGQNVRRLAAPPADERYFFGAQAKNAAFDAKRQAIFDRDQAAAIKINNERTNYETLRANRAAVPSNVIDVSKGRTVDYTSGVPVAFARTPEGSKRLRVGGEGSDAALLEAAAAVRQRLTKAFLDAERALRPQDFVPLGKNVFADIGNKQITIYNDLKHGYDAVEAGNKDLEGHLKALAEKIRTIPFPFINAGDNIPIVAPRTRQNTGPSEREDKFIQDANATNRQHDETRGAALAKDRNIANLRDTTTGQINPGVIQFGQYLADLRGPTLELYKDFVRLGHASSEYASTQSRLITNLSRQARPGIGGAIVSGLTGGFGSEGGSTTGIIEGLAKSGVTTAKYAALGTVLYGLSSAAHQAFSEFEDFNDSLVELEVAFQRSDVTGQAFLNDLADSASETGSNVGEAMDVAASAVRAFGNDTTNVGQQSTKDLQEMAKSFAKEANRIALLTKTSLTDAAGNLKAIALGFKVPTSNFARVTDALANAKIVGGGDEKQIGQGVANISVAAKEAGFSLEEIGNIISDIVAKTDQGGQLVAQRLTRAFSIIGGQAGQSAIRRLNAQLPDAQKIAQGPRVTPAEQIKELSSVYGQLDESQRKLLNNQLGGTANARELIILLEDANKLTSDASLDAAGKGAEEYEKRLKNIRALISQITGNIKNLVSAVGNSGLLAPLGVVLETTLVIVTAARTIVETFDRIPGIIRTIAGLLIGVLVTTKAIGAIRDAGGFKGYVRNIEERYTPGRAYARSQLEQERLAQQNVNGLGAAGVAARKIKAESDARDAARAARKAAFNPGQPVKQFFGNVLAPYNRLDKAADDAVKDFRRRVIQRYQTTRTFGGSRTEGITNALQTPFNPGQIGAGAPGPIRERLRNSLTNGRAQVNGLGLFGSIAIAGAGVSVIAGINEANKRIQHAVNEFGKLRDLPQSFGVEDLKDSAANLRSAAKELKESSSGIFGSVINFLENNRTGTLAKIATERADAADTARKRIEAAQRKARLGDTADIASTIDFSSDDNLSTSIDALGKSGRSATEQMDAFQLALEGINTTGENATRKLTDFENIEVSAAVGAKSVTNFGNIRESNRSSGLSTSDFGVKHQNIAAGLDTYGAFFGVTEYLAHKKNKEGDAIDTARLQTTTDSTVNKVLQTGGFDINDAKGQKYLRGKLNEAYKTIIPDAKTRDQVVNQALADVIAQTKDVRSVTDSTASFANLAAAIPGLAAAKGAEAVVKNSLATDATGTSNAAGARQDISGGLLQSKTELGELQKGLATLEKKTDGSEENKAQLHLLRAQVDAKKVEFAEATVANMEAAFQVYEASQPTENTTQNIQDTLKDIDKRLAVPGITVDTERSLTIAKDQALQQLPGAQIADTFATKRAGTDTRDTLANDQLDIDQTNAELDDFKNRKVTGKALADKQKQLDDQKRKLANDQANYALSERIASSPIGSALQDAKNNLDAAQVNLDQQLVGSEAYNQALRNRDASKVQLADAAIADSQAQFQLDQSTKPTENTTDNLQAQAGELEKELKTKDIGSDAARAIQTQLNALYPQIVASIIADTFAGLRASTDSRDVVGLDKISEQQIQAELNDFNARGVDGKALADKQVELADAKRKTIDDEKDLALQQKIATFDPDSAVDSAQAALLTAAENLRKSKKDTAEYAKAQAAYKKALKDDADAKLQAADQARLLTIDLSNPVQVAKDANKLAGEELKKARSDGSSPDTVNKKIYAKRQTQLAEDAAIFNAFLTAAQNADSLGDISHRAYIDLLQGRLTALQAEAVLLDPNSNGFKQNQDFQTQLRMALKSAGDELSGQFNIGDIKIPTPYQVRRAIKAGNTGSILASNSPNSTAGNVTNDTSTKSVVLNGVPIQQVIALIEELFGVKVKTKNNGRKKP